jgi:hypothetical protein
MRWGLCVGRFSTELVRSYADLDSGEDSTLESTKARTW